MLVALSNTLPAAKIQAAEEPNDPANNSESLKQSQRTTKTQIGLKNAAAADLDGPKLEAPGAFPIPTGFKDDAKIVVIPLKDEVTIGMAAFVERVAAQVDAHTILVLDIRTFGGRVDAAVRIRDALLHMRDRGAMNIAYINPRAISAGALISYATDLIVVAPGATIGAATPVQLGTDGESKSAGEKAISYMRKEMRATAEARGRIGELAEAMVDPDIAIAGLVEKDKLLTLDGKAALQWGVASFEAESLTALYTRIGYGAGPDGKPGKSFTVQEVDWTWAEEIVAWLSSSAVAGLLMTIGMLGLMIGLYSGGSPIPLTVGLSCLLLFFFGHYATNLAGIEDILLFGLGVLLILVEFLIPGYILPGLLGVCCVLGALFLGLIDLENVPLSVQWEFGWLRRALAVVSGSLVATTILGLIAARFLPKSAVARPFVLNAVITRRATDGPLGGAAPTQYDRDPLIGQRGTAASDLRPSGTVKIGDRHYDALADIGFITADSPVKVLRRQGFQIVVAADEN